MDKMEHVFYRQYKGHDLDTLLKQIDKLDLSRIYYTTTYEQKNESKNFFIDYIKKNYRVTINHLLENGYSEILDLIYLLVENNGEMEFVNREPMQVVCLMAFCIAFPLKKEERNVLVMPDEVLVFFKEQDKINLYQKAIVNDLVITYCKGLLSIYGIFHIPFLLEQLEKYEKVYLKSDDVYLLLNIDGIFSNFYSIKENSVHIDLVRQLPEFYDHYAKFEDVPYFECTKDMILNGIFPDEAVVLRFKEYCQLTYQMTEDEFYHLVLIIIEYLKMSAPNEELINYLNSTFEYRLYRNKTIIKQFLKELNQSTRKWLLRGHTESEYKLLKK